MHAAHAGSVKDLAAGRMHLRGLLRGVQDTSLEGHPATARLQASLEQVAALEDEAATAAKQQQQQQQQ